MRVIACLLALSLLMAPVCFAGELTDGNVLHFTLGGLIGGIAKTHVGAGAVVWGLGIGTLLYDAYLNGFAPVEKGSSVAESTAIDVWGTLIGAAMVLLI